MLCPVEQHTVQRKDDDPEEEDCEWTFSLQPHTQAVDEDLAPPPAQGVTADVGPALVAGTVAADDSCEDDSSKLPSSLPQVTKFPSVQVNCLCETLRAVIHAFSLSKAVDDTNKTVEVH